MTTPSATPPVLRVGLAEARNLLAMDFNGFSDPYVTLQLLDHKGDPVAGAPTVKTAIKTKTLSPQWNETVTLGETLDLRTVTTLRFLLFDFDGFKRDDTLGVVDVPVDIAFQLANSANVGESNVGEWFKVTKVEGAMAKDATGELRLTFALGAEAPASATAAAEDDGSPNLLFVTIDSGRDLLPMDSNNLSDPRVKVSLTGQQFTTTTVEKTLKPHWDERFVFLVRDLNTTLELYVEDEDRTVNDFLGRAQVVLADVLRQPDVEAKLDIALLDKKLVADKDRGVLHVRLLWVYDADAEIVAKSMQKKNKKAQSLFHQFTSHFHLAVPDVQVDDEEEQLIAKLNDAEGILEDLSDDDEAQQDAKPLPEGATKIRFAAISIHRAEELPPLDALHFQKETKKPSPPGGGIDAYVAGWLTERPEEFVRTRIHTRKGRRDELSTSFHETLLLPLPDKSDAPVSVTLAVMDWDNIGGDEVVSHVVVPDIAALAARSGGRPFWWNLYGGPLLNVKHKDELDKVNEASDVGSTYRGRVLVSLRLMDKPSTAYDAKPQKRSTSKLPRDKFPTSAVYRLRAHFLSAIGMPEPSGKYYVALSCGVHEITSPQKAAVNRSVEWNATEESDRLVLPTDAAQIPDVVLSLCTGEWERRVVVSYTRFKAAELLTSEFRNTTVEWVPLLADPTTGAVQKNQFPGKILLCLGLGPLESASSQIWDQKAMTDVVNRRVPYQIRVRVHGLKDKAGEERKAPVHVRVQCGDQEIVASRVVLDAQALPVVYSIDVNLPQLTHASQVLIHLQDKDDKGAFIGTLAVSLQDAKDLSGVDTTAIVTRCTSAQLKNNTRPQPTPQWLPLLALDDSIEENTLLMSSVEIIRKQFPDEKLPPPETAGAPAAAPSP